MDVISDGEGSNLASSSGGRKRGSEKRVDEGGLLLRSVECVPFGEFQPRPPSLQSRLVPSESKRTNIPPFQ